MLFRFANNPIYVYTAPTTMMGNIYIRHLKLDIAVETRGKQTCTSWPYHVVYHVTRPATLKKLSTYDRLKFLSSCAEHFILMTLLLVEFYCTVRHISLLQMLHENRPSCCRGLDCNADVNSEILCLLLPLCKII